MLSVVLLTLNLWGLPEIGFVVPSPLREARVGALCERLQVPDAPWDVVLLQEAWVESDRRKLKSCGYPFSADLNDTSKPLDSGLMILSRFPLTDVEAHAYLARPDGRQNPTDGEAFARKGGLIAKVRPPSGTPFWVVSTHLVSRYGTRASGDPYLSTRRAQMRELSAWIGAKAGAEAVILGGDLNFGPGDLMWSELGEWLPGYTEAPGSSQACTICPPNLMHTANEGKVDHLLGSPGLEAKGGKLALDAMITIEGVRSNYSDHFGWQTTFQVPAPR